MSMNVGSASEEDGPAVMATINTTPLVDVMLVLLIIFLITIPVITKTVKVDLPRAVNIPTTTKPDNITIAVGKTGTIYWNDKQVATLTDLINQVKATAVRKPQPEIHIRADKEARFESVGRVIYAIQRGGVVKVGFLTEPDHGIRGSR
jgi:biopolymer transport protein ExbD